MANKTVIFIISLFFFLSTFQASAQPIINNFKDCSEGCPEMIIVPAGSFRMGNSQNTQDKYPENTVYAKPVHTVTIEYSFAVSKYEITRGEFKQFIAETQYDAEEKCRITNGDRWIDDSTDHGWKNVGYPQDDNHPVACVNWHDAKAYTKWLSDKTGQKYRLLSEAEWEYAARAGTDTAYHWGDEASHDLANYGADWYRIKNVRAEGKDQWEYSSPVGSFPANNFGLHDMLGNQHEWVEDCYTYSYENAPTDGSANLGGECYARGIRGASWFVPKEWVVAAFRMSHGPDFRISNVGLRVAREIE